MAFSLLASKPSSIFTTLPLAKTFSPRTPSIVRLSLPAADAQTGHQQSVVRRSGNYNPSVWDYDHLQTLSSVYGGTKYINRAEKLKKSVRLMLKGAKDPLDQLDLIDALQRLGLAYHFKDEIARILESMYLNDGSSHGWQTDNLYATSLQFRLLRQHGFRVHQDVFNSFVDEMGKFKEALCEDTKGLLCLYEASYLSIEGDSILEEARNFTSTHLRQSLMKQKMDQNLAMQVEHALELPLRWRLPRLEARWFIDVYERRQDMNPLLLDLAVLDFNIVQAAHLDDLKHAARWWRGTGLAENLSFARDRLVENFFWAAGKNPEPQFGYDRRMSTRVNALITVIDDIYDVYGTIDELEIFTDAIERWDINVIDQLPDYMRICFLSLFNSVNEIAYDALKEQGLCIISNLKKMWAQLCKAYMIEARWYHSGYTPSLAEYIDNACMSISAPLMLGHTYLRLTKPITEEVLAWLERGSSLIHCSSMIVRLADDLGTSSDEIKRGDVPKSIQCYMHETGASEEEARDHIKHLIGETWKKMNEIRLKESQIPDTVISAAMNLGRAAQCLYQYGDGHGVGDAETKERVLQLYIEPIQYVY